MFMPRPPVLGGNSRERNILSFRLFSRSGRLRCDADDQLSEVLSPEHSQEGSRGILQSIDDVFAVPQSAVADPLGRLFQESRAVGVDELGLYEALSVMLLRRMVAMRTPELSEPSPGPAPLYVDTSPQTGTRAYVLSRGRT